MEKDFWVCWMLDLLFRNADWQNSLVFKGGTSLSKVFGVIQRFSEDIDLSVSPRLLGIGEENTGKAMTGSRRTRDQLMETLEDRCCQWVETRLCPELENSIKAVLGPRPGGRPWLEYWRDGASHSPVLIFHYPDTQPGGFAYILRSVKLEFGSLTDQQPAGTHRIRPWLADELPGEMRGMGCEVVALDVMRTFWEKATILHSEHHREAGTSMPPRYSRHYADTAALIHSGFAEEARRNPDLRQRVVDWKSQFFARRWARYDLAVPGSFRLLPRGERMEELEKDYQAMREMFLGEPLSFSAIMDTLRDFEARINS